jgi:integrase
MSIKLQKRGQSWRLRYDLEPDASGARQRRSATFIGTKAEAQAQAAKLLASIANGVDVDPSKLTVADHLRAWLNGPHGLSAKTVERYRDLAEHQIIPHLGGWSLQKLRPAHIADWHAALLKSGGQGGRPLSSRTTGHAHRVLHRGLEIALARELVARNVASVIAPPKVADVEVKSLKADQVARVVEALKGHWLEPIAILALTSGARRGEILGLSWGSVDLMRGSMTIERSLEQTRAGLSFKQPKTRSGRRHVSLPVLAIEALKAHRLRQLEMRMRLGLGKPNDDTLVFASAHDGSPVPPNNLSRDWAIFVKARKLPAASFHSLRHSHASLLISSKLDPVSVARRIGHASASTTMRIYAHLWKESDDLAANAIDAALGKS